MKEVTPEGEVEKKPKDVPKNDAPAILPSYDSSDGISNMPRSLDGAIVAGAEEESAVSQETANSSQAEETSASDGSPPAVKAKQQDEEPL